VSVVSRDRLFNKPVAGPDPLLSAGRALVADGRSGATREEGTRLLELDSTVGRTGRRDGPVGTCFGFSIVSPLSFQYLRTGDGDPLAVTESAEIADVPTGDPVLEWAPTPAIPSRARLYDDGARFQLWIEAGGWFIVDPSAPSITVPHDEDPVRREERLWGLPAVLSFLQRGDLPLHAAAVEVEDGAVILGAPGRSGKTALAAAFVSAGYRLLSEDLTCIRVSDPPVAIPGPAMLRLEQEVADSIEINNVAVTLEAESPQSRIHFSVDPKLRGDCAPVPIRAIVLLRPSEHGVWLERVAPVEALRDLWPLSFRLPFNSDTDRAFGGLADLVRETPIWNLYRPLRTAALPATLAGLVGGV
jgi:hypothetical protein